VLQQPHSPDFSLSSTGNHRVRKLQFPVLLLALLVHAYRDASIIINYKIGAVMRYPVPFGHRGAPKSQI
jgi:hypothetical protein